MSTNLTLADGREDGVAIVLTDLLAAPVESARECDLVALTEAFTLHPSPYCPYCPHRLRPSPALDGV